MILMELVQRVVETSILTWKFASQIEMGISEVTTKEAKCEREEDKEQHLEESPQLEEASEEE